MLVKIYTGGDHVLPGIAVVISGNLGMVIFILHVVRLLRSAKCQAEEIEPYKQEIWYTGSKNPEQEHNPIFLIGQR